MSDLRSISFAIAALWLCLCAACAKSTGPDAGTNTNWLKQCHASAECGGESECLCGVCTLSCSQSSTCGQVDRRTRCLDLGEQRCGDEATGSACLLPNTEPEDAGAENPEPDAGLALEREENSVIVTDRYRRCDVDDDCILVGTSCNGCCNEDAIRARDREAYEQNHELACDDYRGPQCDCGWSSIVPRCRAGKCVATDADLARDCFAPDRDPNLVRIPNALGCECDRPGLEFCGQYGALVCARGEDGLRWQQIFSSEGAGGPCDFAADECEQTRIRTSAGACLAEFQSCMQLPDGTYCGHGCYTTQACPDAGCNAYERYQCSPEPASESVVEGLCGGVRYRFAGFGAGGYNAYWDTDTGALLAYTFINDSFLYCTNSEAELRYGDLSVITECERILDPGAIDLCQ